jgi:hypothetical protein
MLSQPESPGKDDIEQGREEQEDLQDGRRTDASCVLVIRQRAKSHCRKQRQC